MSHLFNILRQQAFSEPRGKAESGEKGSIFGTCTLLDTPFCSSLRSAGFSNDVAESKTRV